MSSNDVLIIGAAEVEAALQGNEQRVLDAVQKAYEAHSMGDSSLPHSSFLRFPDSDRDRIICLPAYLGGEFQLAGVKWIASMPENVLAGIERASAVVILNDRLTGRPELVIEGSIISKQRTAASAALAAQLLASSPPTVIGFVGCGPINLEVARFLSAIWPQSTGFMAFDLQPDRAEEFCESVVVTNPESTVSVAASLEHLLGSCSVVSFGTTAIAPYLDNLDACPPGATILHVSLRDLAPDVILSNQNVVDDIDHVNRAATSIHLASEATGSTDFIHGSLGDILLGKITTPEPCDDKIIFSPFGLGVLDLAVADLVRKIVTEQGGGTRVPSFLP